jgi:hypothetical protein
VLGQPGRRFGNPLCGRFQSVQDVVNAACGERTELHRVRWCPLRNRVKLKPAIESSAHADDAVETPPRRTVPQNKVNQRRAKSHLREGQILDSIDDKLELELKDIA